MPAITPDNVRELQKRFTERLNEQLGAAQGQKKLSVEAEIAGRRAYLQERVAALKATETARQSALTRFDADIQRRKKQIAQIEAGLKEGERIGKEGGGGGREKPVKAAARKRAKPG
jgi:hypothetical protein